MREKPVVIEHERVVDDPPRVIERRHITEDAPGRGLIKHRREVGQEDVVIEPGGAPAEAKRSAKAKRAVREAKTNEPKESTGKRVIRAEAEVTILGPDRMSIRLFRKGHKAAVTPTPKSSNRNSAIIQFVGRGAAGVTARRFVFTRPSTAGSRHKATAPPRSTRSGS